MECTNCGTLIPVRKSLQRGKSRHPDKCPECGDMLEKDESTGPDGDLIQK